MIAGSQGSARMPPGPFPGSGGLYAGRIVKHIAAARSGRP